GPGHEPRLRALARGAPVAAGGGGLPGAGPGRGPPRPRPRNRRPRRGGLRPGLHGPLPALRLRRGRRVRAPGGPGVRLGFDATTLAGRISGVGYYTARLLQCLANGSGDGLVEGVVVLSNREVPVSTGGRLEVYPRRRFPVRSVWM